MSQKRKFVFMADVAGTPEKGSFRGVASSTNPDRRKQALSSAALSGMTEQGPIPLVSGVEHVPAVVVVDAEIGTVTEFHVSDTDAGQALEFTGKLDPTHPAYEFYCAKLDQESEFSHGYKVSIGGWVAPDAVKRVFKAGDAYEELQSFRLDHLLLCRADAAVNQETSFVGMADPGDWMGAVFGAAVDEESEIEEPDQTLPDSLVGKGDGGDGMDKGALAKIFGGLKDLFEGKGEPLGGIAEIVADVAASEVPAPDVAAAVAETAPPVDVKALVAEAVTEAMAPLVAAVTEAMAAAPVVEVEVAPGVAETEIADVAGDVPAEVLAETEDAPVQAETVVDETPAVTGMSDEDATNLNANLQSIWVGVQALQTTLNAQDTRLQSLELVGKAGTGSAQAPPAGPAVPATTQKRGVGIGAFVCGGTR